MNTATILYSLLCPALVSQDVVELTGHSAPVLSVAFNPDGNMCASAGGDPLQPNAQAEVILWDVAQRRKHSMLRGHTGYVDVVMFGRDGNTLVTHSRRSIGGGQLKLW